MEKYPWPQSFTRYKTSLSRLVHVLAAGGHEAACWLAEAPLAPGNEKCRPDVLSLMSKVIFPEFLSGRGSILSSHSRPIKKPTQSARRIFGGFSACSGAKVR